MPTKSNRNIIEKLRLVLPAYLGIQFSCIVFLLLVRWWVSMYFSTLQLDEREWAFIFLFFPFAPILIWESISNVPARIKNKKNFVRWFVIITWLFTASLLFISQHYLVESAGEIVSVNKIEEIDFENTSRFYKIETIYPDTSQASTHVEFRSSGKHNHDLNITIYFVLPLLSESGEAHLNSRDCWYGIKYSMQISNNVSDEEKENQYKIFREECMENERGRSYSSVQYFERPLFPAEYNNFVSAIENGANNRASERPLILVAGFEPLERKLTLGLVSFFFFFFGGIIGVSVLSIKYVRQKEKQNLRINKKIVWYWLGAIGAFCLAAVAIIQYTAGRKENPSYEFELARSKEITVTCQRGISGLNFVCLEYFQGYDPTSIIDSPKPSSGYAKQYHLKDNPLTNEEIQIALANGDSSSMMCTDCFNISNRIKVDYCNGKKLPHWITIYSNDRKPIVSVEYKNVRGFFLSNCPELRGTLE